ncbi:MAG: type I-PGING CRISPR-associated protein Cas5p [Bacteroidales bacterium]|nr:type I-PGING CRISPR-associated protein Cas5p [Bacteroidales bacterium]
MRDTNIELLKNVPTLNAHAIVCIRPLAPLSMVSDMPGSYYKTLRKPDKKMLCGLFENLMGWHFDSADRKQLYKELKQIRKKQKVDFKDKYFGSTYQPLLMEYFEIDGDIEIDQFKSVCFYDDLWSRSFRRSDSNKHINGCRNADYRIIAKKNQAFIEIDNTDLKSADKEKEKDSWFKKNIGSYPYYYSSPTKREYISIDGVFKLKLSMNEDLLLLLTQNVQANNIGYLGNNEGWVDIKIESL